MRFLLIFISLLLLANCAVNPPIAQHQPTSQHTVDITEALESGITRAFRDVPKHSIIAIVHVATPNRVLYDFLLGELEHILVDSGFKPSY